MKPKSVETPFGNILVSESVPPGTILIVPPITPVRRLNVTTGEMVETWEWNATAAGVITNIKCDL